MGLKDLERMQVRQDYRNLWHKDLMSTPTFDPGFCCYACCCPYCASYQLRKRALYDDMSRYRCCAGYMPCSGRCGEKHCPAFCLCCEVFCCFGSSVSSTRFLIQDEFNIKTTGCDNCIIGCMVCLKQVSCICNIIACLTGSSEINDIAECLSCISETVYCTVCACMQTQHKIELNKRDGKLEPLPVMAAPQVQQMSRGIDQSTPPPGYPPQGSPPMGYPHQPPPYMPPPQAYGQPMKGASPGHGSYPPVGYHPQHPHYPPQMYHPHAPDPYIPGPAPGGYPAGPASGPYAKGQDSGFVPGPESGDYSPSLPPPSFVPGPESGPYPPSQPPPPPPSMGFVPGPESGPYLPSQPPPPPPSFYAEPSAPLSPVEEEPKTTTPPKESKTTAPPSNNPPK